MRSGADHFLAIDLGASSGRAVLGAVRPPGIELREVHRFPNVPLRSGPSLSWNFPELLENVKLAIRKGWENCAGRLLSVGVDTWGVDFGLIDKDGRLLENPVHYRDGRTDGVMDEVFRLVPKERIFEVTGIQFMQINTLYQLYAAARKNPSLLERADKLLLVPGLFNLSLSGAKAAEFTNATTTQFYDIRAGTWATEIIEELGIPTRLLPDIVPPGTTLGPLLPKIQEETGTGPVPVVAPSCHDTACAVAAAPARGGEWAFISSGTWSLVGAELAEPVQTKEALEYNFTNEGGVGGAVRFLKNVMGLWILEECKREWGRLTYEELFRLASKERPFERFIYPDSARFLHPESMTKAIAGFCVETRQSAPRAPAEFVRCILESLAFRYRSVIENLQEILGRKVEVAHVLGGGSQNTLLCQMTANALGAPVLAGPVEATSIGNLVVQAIAAGSLSSLGEARDLLRASYPLERYEPHDEARWSEARARYAEVERAGA